MLHLLFEWLSQLNPHFSVFAYLSIKVMMAALSALLLGLVLGPFFIQLMKRRQLNQVIRLDGPQTHLKHKQQIPTMGGVVILLSLCVSVLLWADLTNPFIWLSLAVVLGFGTIGFVDDYLKLLKYSSSGLRVWQKYTAQSILALVVCVYLFAFSSLSQHSYLLIPFVKSVYLPIGWGAVVLGYLTVVGSSNAVNLTDGLDGLAIMPVILIISALSLMAYLSGHVVFSGYLYIPHIPLMSELTVIGASVVGAGLSFLWFNAYPAQLFMGDVGSLSLGALIGLFAVLVRQELVLMLMAIIFVLEALSVILQVGSFKLTGKRIFRMAPLHHHLELKGWSEPKIIVRFWIITAIFVLVGLVSLKIR